MLRVTVYGTSAGIAEEHLRGMQNKEKFKRIPVTSLLSNAGAASSTDRNDLRSSSEDKEGLSEGEADSKEAARRSSSSFRPRWSKEEDIKLTELVTEYGARNWNAIATHFEGRNGRQVGILTSPHECN